MTDESSADGTPRLPVDAWLQPLANSPCGDDVEYDIDFDTGRFKFNGWDYLSLKHIKSEGALSPAAADKLKAAGGVFGGYYGLEQALWFAPQGEVDQFSWRRSNDFDVVGAEAKAVRDSVGLMETSGFAKYSVKGPGAEAFLDTLLACRIPAVGRMTLAPMLKHDGKLIGH